MDLIGHPLDEIGDQPGELRFRHRGSMGGFVQAAFVGLLAPPAYFFVDPVAGWLILGFTAVLAAGFAGNGLIAWDLRLNLASREYELWRGLRRMRRRVAGGFADFDKIAIAPGWYDGVCVFLVPLGSSRGYLLYRDLELDGARRKGGAVAGRLGLPVEEIFPVDTWTPVEADLHFPPPVLPLAVSTVGDGVRIEFAPQRGLWRRWIRADPRGLESGIDLTMPWGRRYPSSTRVAWKDVTQVIVSNVEDGASRIRRDWRIAMQALWRQRCAELKQPPSVPPWWGVFWFCYEGHMREYEKLVCIFRRRGAFLSAGSNWMLGDAGLLWLYSGIVAFGRSQGARFTTNS